MDEKKAPRPNLEFVRAAGISASEAERQVEYQQLLLFAEQCGVSREVVDAKLLTASVKQVREWIASGKARAAGMTNDRRVFTAPVSGRYHVVSGQEPHLAENCTDRCRQLRIGP